MWCDHGKLCEEKQIENYGYAFLAGRAGLNRCTRKRDPKPLKKPRGAANVQSSQKVLISRACETKLGCHCSLVPRERNKSLQDCLWKVTADN